MKKRPCRSLHRWLLLSSALLLIGTNVMGQDSRDIDRTATFFNGRFWEKQTAGEKLAYVDGFIEGLSAAKSVAEKYVAPINKDLGVAIKLAVDAGLLVQIRSPEGAK